MLEQQDTIRREEDKKRRLQDEARRVQRERDQRRLEAQERAEDARLRERDKQQRLQEDAEQRRVIEALLSSARSIVQSGPAARQSPVMSARDPGYGPPTPDEEPFLFPQKPGGPGRASPAMSIANSVMSGSSSRFQSSVHKQWHRLKEAIFKRSKIILA